MKKTYRNKHTHTNKQTHINIMKCFGYIYVYFSQAKEKIRTEVGKCLKRSTNVQQHSC